MAWIEGRVVMYNYCFYINQLLLQSMPKENETQNQPYHTTRSSTMRRLKNKHRQERRFQPSRET